MRPVTTCTQVPAGTLTKFSDALTLVSRSPCPHDTRRIPEPRLLGLRARRALTPTPGSWNQEREAVAARNGILPWLERRRSAAARCPREGNSRSPARRKPWRFPLAMAARWRSRKRASAPPSSPCTTAAHPSLPPLGKGRPRRSRSSIATRADAHKQIAARLIGIGRRRGSPQAAGNGDGEHVPRSLQRRTGWRNRGASCGHLDRLRCLSGWRAVILIAASRSARVQATKEYGHHTQPTGGRLTGPGMKGDDRG